MTRIRPLLRATAGAFRASLQVALAYPASILAEMLGAVLHVVWAVLPLLFVFHYREGVAGWSRDEGLLVLGAFIVLDGLLGTIIEPNLRAIVEHVRQGTLDFLLLKPVDAQWLVSIQRTAPARVPDAVAGAIVLLVGASRLPDGPALPQILLCSLLLGSAFFILHSMWMLVAGLSFVFVRIDNLSWLIRSGLDAGRWPLPFYRGAVRVILTFVLPVGVMTTWPALALRSLLAPIHVLQALGVAVAWVVVARFAWLTSLRRYSSASS
jgi:ABC-2 type transport system permease protein